MYLISAVHIETIGLRCGNVQYYHPSNARCVRVCKAGRGLASSVEWDLGVGRGGGEARCVGILSWSRDVLNPSSVGWLLLP